MNLLECQHCKILFDPMVKGRHYVEINTTFRYAIPCRNCGHMNYSDNVSGRLKWIKQTTQVTEE